MDFFSLNLALGQVGEGKDCILSDFDNQFFFSPKYHHLWMRFLLQTTLVGLGLWCLMSL